MSSEGHEAEFDSRSLDAIADADPYPYWYEDADQPLSNPTLVRTETCDLCIVGGGYTGLWAAIIAKERDPSRDVVLIDAHEIGSAASGRNGGFMDASLTHGIANGQERFPKEIALLEELGIANLNEIEAAIKRYSIDCDFERNGVIEVASITQPPSYLDELRDDYLQLKSLGQKVTWLDREQMQKQVNSPTYSGGLWVHDRAAIVDPARLCWGLKAAAEYLGVRIYEDSKATSIERDGVGVLVTTPLGRVRAGKVALATNAVKPLLKRINNYIAPVYDYCMVTEPLIGPRQEEREYRPMQRIGATGQTPRQEGIPLRQMRPFGLVALIPVWVVQARLRLRLAVDRHTMPHETLHLLGSSTRKFHAERHAGVMPHHDGAIDLQMR